MIDTAKAANLYALHLQPPFIAMSDVAFRFTVYKDADLFDFINAPVGKGLPIGDKLRPLIASLSHWDFVCKPLF